MTLIEPKLNSKIKIPRNTESISMMGICDNCKCESKDLDYTDVFENKQKIMMLYCKKCRNEQ